MNSAFDPYYKWLAIPPDEQPPDHYRLLGLACFESDPDVIEHAYEARMAQLRTYQSGPHSVDSQRLLNEVATARNTLMNAAARAAYDAAISVPPSQEKRILSSPPQAVPMQSPAQSSTPIPPPSPPLSQIPFGTDSFAENPEPRVPSVLLLDVSYSMQGSPIAELNAGLRVYREELAKDSLASKRVEVAIVTFGDAVETALEFVTASSFSAPTLAVKGRTPMGEAIGTAVDMVEERKSVYRTNGIAYYRPWIFLITDGAPTDEWQPVVHRIREGEESKSFSFFAIGVKGANMDVLSQISVRRPLRLQGLRFRDMFRWLSNSQRSVSRSTLGAEVPLENPTAPGGWASV